MKKIINLLLIALLPTLLSAIEFENRSGFSIIKYQGEWSDGEVIEVFKHSELYTISAFAEWDKKKEAQVHTIIIKLKDDSLSAKGSIEKEKIKISGIREDERDALLKFLTS